MTTRRSGATFATALLRYQCFTSKKQWCAIDFDQHLKEARLSFGYRSTQKLLLFWVEHGLAKKVSRGVYAATKSAAYFEAYWGKAYLKRAVQTQRTKAKNNIGKPKPKKKAPPIKVKPPKEIASVIAKNTNTPSWLIGL